MQTAQHKKTIIGATVLVLITVLGFGWSVNSAKLAAQARAILLNQVNQALNGRLEAADIAISISKVVIRQAVIFDKENAEVAKCERIIMSYGFRDFLTGRIGMEAVKDITLDAPALILAQAKEGQWNIHTLIKPVTQGKTTYRGPIRIQKGTAVITTPAAAAGIENLSMVLMMGDHLTGEIQQGTLTYAGQKMTIKGQGNFQYTDGVFTLEQVETELLGGKGQLAGTVQIKEPAVLQLYFNVYGVDSAQLADDIAMSGMGNYYTVIEGSQDRPVISGTFDIAQGMVRNVPFTGAKGSFHLTDHVLSIDQVAAEAMGGNVAAAGTVQLAGTNEYRLHVTGNGLDIGRLIDASKPSSVKAAPPAIAGLVSLQADVTGATIIQYAAGTFTMPAGTFADTAFSNAQGAFHYDGRQLVFDHARAEVNGGIVSGSGTLGIERDEYVLMLAGTGLESGLLTNKQVQGKLAFDANAQGTGDVQNAVVRGSFRMGSGTVSGIPFTSAQGNFTRQAGQFSFDAVNFQMLGGLINGDIVMNGNSFAVKIQTPQGTVEASERQLLEKALQGLIKKQDKAANQSTESTDDPAANDQTGKIVDIFKQLKEKTRK